MTNGIDAAQRVVGWIAIFAFMLLAYQSMDPAYDLTWPVIAGIIILVAMLLGKVGQIGDLVESWRGNNRGKE